MTKEEFTNRLYRQFSGFLNNAGRSARLEIVGMAEILPPVQLLEWVKEQRNKALNDPALSVYNRVTRHSMGTPAAAAETIVSIIDNDKKGNVDWLAEFSLAAHILSNYMTEIAENWRYKDTVRHYMNGSYADARARAFANYITEATAQQTPTAAKQEPPAPLPFEALFVSPEAMQKALSAVKGIDKPILNAHGFWAGNYHKWTALVTFYNFCIGRDLLKERTPKGRALDAISQRFGQGKASKNTGSNPPDNRLLYKLNRYFDAMK